MVNVGIFYGPLEYVYYGHLVYFMTIWLSSSDLVYFYTLWYIESRKIWQPRFVNTERAHDEFDFKNKVYVTQIFLLRLSLRKRNSCSAEFKERSPKK
jgi:hypothetical protein